MRCKISGLVLEQCGVMCIQIWLGLLGIPNWALDSMEKHGLVGTRAILWGTRHDLAPYQFSGSSDLYGDDQICSWKCQMVIDLAMGICCTTKVSHLAMLIYYLEVGLFRKNCKCLTICPSQVMRFNTIVLKYITSQSWSCFDPLPLRNYITRNKHNLTNEWWYSCVQKSLFT